MSMRVLRDPTELYSRVFDYPYPPMVVDNRKLRYQEVIASRKFSGCNLALERMLKRINLKDALNVVNNLDYYTEVHSKALSVLLIARYMCLLKGVSFDETVAYCKKYNWFY